MKKNSRDSKRKFHREKTKRIKEFILMYSLEKKSNKLSKHAKQYMDSTRGKLLLLKKEITPYNVEHSHYCLSNQTTSNH
jgi:hypothetical protein